MMQEKIFTDHLIVGSGIAGLALALKLAEFSKVLLIAKSELGDNATRYAQGGIASVLDPVQDSFDKHCQDTLLAGAGLCHNNIVEMVIQSGPQAIDELIKLGVNFSRTDDQQGYHLTKEGGHSARRIIHATDFTGQELLNTLITKVRAHPHIQCFDNQFAIDLITSDKYVPNFSGNHCLGAYVFDRASKQIYQILSSRTYLCTGGHGRVYLYTSNPSNATGDGVAMGWRAGCKVANLEFMQFHPTCLFHAEAKTFLISEALRGEGGIIKNNHSFAFVDKFHALGSLAPRDIVARAIDFELKNSSESHVYVDARHLGESFLKTRFPNIYTTLKHYGIDMAEQMIPVVPAAHYSCGGLVVDESGRTQVENLFALGEVACTGLHGANRLASNSLLEALVFADRVAQYVKQQGQISNVQYSIPKWNPGTAAEPDELVVLAQTWDEIRRLMWNYVGIVRTDKRLKRALDRIVAIRQELDTYYWDYQLTEQLIEVRNLAQVAWLTIRCAISRKESRGIHYNSDYPHKDDEHGCKDTIIW